MSKEEAILHYKAAMAVFKTWLKAGIISHSDLATISTTLAQKYGLSMSSIYLENDLLCRENRVIYGSEGGLYEKENNEN